VATERPRAFYARGRWRKSIVADLQAGGRNTNAARDLAQYQATLVDGDH